MKLTPEMKDQMDGIKKRIQEITKDMSPMEKNIFYNSLHIQLKEAVEKKGGEKDA